MALRTDLSKYRSDYSLVTMAGGVMFDLTGLLAFDNESRAKFER
jgi:hypothetical protein